MNFKNFPESSLETFKKLAYITSVCMFSNVFILHVAIIRTMELTDRKMEWAKTHDLHTIP